MSGFLKLILLLSLSLDRVPPRCESEHSSVFSKTPELSSLWGWLPAVFCRGHPTALLFAGWWLRVALPWPSCCCA